MNACRTDLILPADGPAIDRGMKAAPPVPGRAHPAGQPRGVGPRPCGGLLPGRAGVSCHCARTLRPRDAGGARRRGYWRRGGRDAVGRTRHRLGAIRQARPALPAGQPKRRFVVPAFGDRGERHGPCLRSFVIACRMVPHQRGRPAIAAAVERRGAGVQVPRSGWAPIRADLVSARAGPRCVAQGSIRRAVPGYRPQRAFRRFYAAQSRVLSRAGLAGERTIGESGSRPGKVGRPAARAGAGNGPTPGLGCRSGS